MNEFYEYDEESDSLFISMPVNYEYGRVIKIDEGVLLELDTNNNPRAIEILSASIILDTESKNLIEENIRKVSFTISVTADTITVSIELWSENKNHEIGKELNLLNSMNMPVDTERFTLKT